MSIFATVKQSARCLNCTSSQPSILTGTEPELWIAVGSRFSVVEERYQVTAWNRFYPLFCIVITNMTEEVELFSRIWLNLELNAFQLLVQPKTRHLRPYGWETGTSVPPFHLQEPPNPQLRFGSLPYDGALQYARFPPPWLQRPGPLPPRTLPGAIERHREVRRRGSGDGGDGSGCGGEEPCPPLRTLDELTDDDHANFSDDSLEELLPPPLTSKRNSIAWEVPLGVDDTDPLLTPGSTKVVGRRKRRSGEHSSKCCRVPS